MVEFCNHCGSSLPRGDVTIKHGKVFTSPDYACPSCQKLANSDATQDKTVYPDPEENSDIVIKEGKISQKDIS